jgi:hypothetical protein
MPNVRLDDQVFKIAQARAAQAGYSSVDKYVADVVVHDTDDEADNFDRLFTPEVIAQLDKISADIRAGGKTYSTDEVREHFENKRKAWLANHAS